MFTQGTFPSFHTPTQAPATGSPAWSRTCPLITAVRGSAGAAPALGPRATNGPATINPIVLSIASARRPPPAGATSKSSGAVSSTGRFERSRCSAVSAQNSTRASRPCGGTSVNPAPARYRPLSGSEATCSRRARASSVVIEPSSRGTSRRTTTESPRANPAPEDEPVISDSGSRSPTPTGVRSTLRHG